MIFQIEMILILRIIILNGMKKNHKILIILAVSLNLPILLLISCKKDADNNVIVDKDGNSYKTVQIGTQTWMAENLRTTTYQDGTSITYSPDAAAWSASTDAYCWYDNDETAHKESDGALYSQYAVVSTKGLCPTGWHVPSDSEWTILMEYLGGTAIAGGKLKKQGTDEWTSPNTGADNSTGFTALPSGFRATSGYFEFLNTYGFWWSTDSHSDEQGYTWVVNNMNTNFYKNIWSKHAGYSVRCIKD
jgi:uncharacterized protein (TIGR02145 family)